MKEDMDKVNEQKCCMRCQCSCMVGKAGKGSKFVDRVYSTVLLSVQTTGSCSTGSSSASMWHSFMPQSKRTPVAFLHRGTRLAKGTSIAVPFDQYYLSIHREIIVGMWMARMSSPSTHTLDHIVHLTAPGTFHDTAEQFRRLGFKFVCSLLPYFPH